MEINISIMSGAGNIFAVIDNSNIGYIKEFYSTICTDIIKLSEFKNIKCEGIIVLNNSDDLDFDVWFFNPDGSSGMMCGNGGRCAFAYAYSQQIIKSGKELYSFSMAGQIYKAKLNNNLVSLYLPLPIEYIPDIDVNIDNLNIKGAYVNVGSDHFIFDYDNSELKKIFDFESNELIEFIKKIRYRYDIFQRGVNVNYFRKIDNSNFQLRTYERGVEYITGACGTGAISTAWHLVNQNQSAYPVKIIPPSNLKLTVDLEIVNNKSKSLILTGSADLINVIKFNI